MRKKQIEKLIRNNITAETRIKWEDIEKKAGIYNIQPIKRGLALRKVVPIAIALTLVSTITISSLLVLGNRNDDYSTPAEPISSVEASGSVSVADTSTDSSDIIKVTCNTDGVDLLPVFEADYGYYLYTYTGYFDKEKDSISVSATETREYYDKICKNITGSSLDDLSVDSLIFLGQSHYTFGDKKQIIKMYAFRGVTDQFYLVGEQDGYFGLFVCSGFVYNNDDRKAGKKPNLSDFEELYGFNNHNDIEVINVYTEVDATRALTEKEIYYKEKAAAKIITEIETFKSFVKSFEKTSKKAESFVYPEGKTSSLMESKDAVLIRLKLKNSLILDVCYYSASNYISIGTEFFSLGDNEFSTWTQSVLK